MFPFKSMSLQTKKGGGGPTPRTTPLDLREPFFFLWDFYRYHIIILVDWIAPLFSAITV